jgi:hypothetical protein
MQQQGCQASRLSSDNLLAQTANGAMVMLPLRAAAGQG